MRRTSFNDTVSVAGLIVNVCDTEGAAAYVSLPSWFAVTVQLPALAIVSVFDSSSAQLPDAVNVTGLPEPPPVAETANGVSP